MIVEEYNYQPQKPISNIRKGKTISFIISIIKKTPKYFHSAIQTKNIIKQLNENDYTQIIVEQFTAILLENNSSISAQNQYSDLFYGTKGFPDIYFYQAEKGKTNKPIFVLESKILPAPTKNREQEYVIGEKENGGIERFKIGKHGTGFDECGIIGFVRDKDFNHWEKKINEWIKDLSMKDSFWNIDEKVVPQEKNRYYSYLISFAHRIKSNDVRLHHFWLITNNTTH